MKELQARIVHGHLPRRSLALLVALVLAGSGMAQCTSTISTFPYFEGFETGPVWTSGGTNSDWAWGVPAHPTINVAWEGTMAWCVGGLAGSYYANGQQSWLETPCFDLSVLNYPYLSFKIFWETEPNYDGLGLQYSPNGGTTWINLGSANDGDCLTTNWFNSTNITALNMASPRHGWSGTSISGGCANGGGSGGWVTAAHCLGDLPTADPVKFRFIFGAGTICNSFDGVAIDGFRIGEAPALDPEIGYTCAGSTVNFTNGALVCPLNSTWSFGDPASGGNNTATGTNVSHTFSGGGTYTVSLTMTGPCTQPITETVEVTIGELTVETTDVGCVPNSGTATAVVTGSNGPFTYDWSPGTGNTQTITGLAPGDYTVLVQATGMCPLQGTGTVSAGNGALSVVTDQSDVSCSGLADGSASVTVAGGSGVYAYQWSPSGGNASTATDLEAGTYTCAIEDDAGCTAEAEVIIAEPTPVLLVAVDDLGLCAGQSTTLTAEVEGGTAPYTLVWDPEGPDVSPTQTTTYTVSATDANGCTSAEDDVVVTVTPGFTPSFSWDRDQGCAPLCVTFTDETPVVGVRTWSFGDGTVLVDPANAVHCYNEAALYDVTLTVVSDDGCTGSTTESGIIDVVPTPVAAFSATPQVASIDAPTFQFMDRSTHASLWFWSFGDPLNSVSSERSPQFTYPSVGCYTVRLEVANTDGCSASTDAEVCVEDAFALYAPNAFSPNNDGINDGFYVRTTVATPSFFQLDLYDRWGRLLHTTQDPYQTWEGEGAPQGVYTWQVRLRDSEKKMQERSGHVTLIR